MPAAKPVASSQAPLGGVEARPGTWANLAALPPHVRGELIGNTLYTQARPRPRHALAGLGIGSGLKTPFGDGRDGPGGWWILVAPGLCMPGAKEVAPAVAGWRRERLPRLPDDPIEVVPDWVCEVLSPSNARYDWLVKRPFYAQLGVAWLWFVDVDARFVQVHQLVDGAWVERAMAGGSDKARLPPFAEVELDLSLWWPEE